MRLCIRSVLLATVLLCVTACRDTERQIKDIQTQADERVRKAERAAMEKVAAAEQRMQATKGELEAALVKAKADAEGAIRDAQASADVQTKEVALALTKARDAYKAEARAKLANLNEDTRDVAAKAPAKAKALVAKIMPEIAKQQKVIFKDISAFDHATLETFKATKSTLDADLAKLKALIQSARAKVH